MGRRKECPIRKEKYFIYDKNKDTSTCQLDIEDAFEIDSTSDDEKVDKNKPKEKELPRKCNSVLKVT